MALIDKLTAIADAIRGKTGKTEEMTLDQMASEIMEIQTGGGGSGSDLDGFLQGTITEINSHVESVADKVLYGNASVTSVNLPNAKTIGSAAFSQSAVKYISAPLLRNAPYRFLFAAEACEMVDLPLLESAEGQSFLGTKIKHIPNVRNLVDLGDQAFSGCTMVEDKELILESIVNMGYGVFERITSIELVDIGVGFAPLSGTLRQLVFSGCTSLKTLIIRQNTMLALQNITAFTGTPFASDGTGGTVYVPQALIEQYQQATNWSTLYAAGTCNFVAIEGSEYE